jgi:uncharacterized membrane protein YdfJ with MMPL/SSD domain
VTTAAAVLAVTFVAIGLSKISMIQMFGLGTALAIVLDATLIRGRACGADKVLLCRGGSRRVALGR